jgi:hypothetical protein
VRAPDGLFGVGGSHFDLLRRPITSKTKEKQQQLEQPPF